MKTAKRRIALFVLLTAVLSLPGYWLDVHSGILSPRLNAAVVMWAPALAAGLTLLATRGRLSEIGWGPAPRRYVAIALLLPLASSLPAYLVTWVGGLGGFDPWRWAAALPYGLNASGPVAAAALLLSVGLFDKFSRALGEEIGWRGLLVPELAKVTTPVRAGLISGAIWATWHFPAIILGDYNAHGVPIPLQVTLFAVGVVADGIVYAWLRLASRSIWPPALLHASFNLFTQSFFDQATVERPWTTWLVGEFGLGIPILSVIVALIVVPRLRRMSGPAGGGGAVGGADDRLQVSTSPS